ncbi:centromere protein M [Polyodon spathula]|uniref:centromere protein M n=1 Tax=Polyodon spathula TaxID=7913 RepID=UPI001B7E88D1|nr:centromere protein M [Polyodon spathula]
MSVLKTFNKLPELNTANIMLVGSDVSDLEKLARSIMEENKSFNVNVRLAQSLPLPVENEDSRPRIDLLVLMVNLRSSYSLSLAESSLQYIDPHYFLGKVYFLATGARSSHLSSDLLPSLRLLSASTRSPVLFADLESDSGRLTVAHRFLTLLKIAAGLEPGASALFLNTLLRGAPPPSTNEDPLN